MNRYRLSLITMVVGVAIALIIGCSQNETPLSPASTGGGNPDMGLAPPPHVPLPIFNAFLPNTAMIEVWEANYVDGMMVIEFDYLQIREERESGSLILKISPDFSIMELYTSTGAPIYSYSISNVETGNTITIRFENGDYTYVYTERADNTIRREVSAGAASDFIEFADLAEMELAYSLYDNMAGGGSTPPPLLMPYEEQLLASFSSWVAFLESVDEPDYTVAIETGWLLMQDESFLSFLDDTFGPQIDPLKGVICNIFAAVNRLCGAALDYDESLYNDDDVMAVCWTAFIGSMLCWLFGW